MTRLSHHYKNLLFLLSVSIALIISCDRSNQNWTIKGAINGDTWQNIDMAYLYSIDDEFQGDILIDSTKVKDNNFIFTRTSTSAEQLDEYGVSFSRGGGLIYPVLIRNGQTITLNANDAFYNSHYSGSDLQKTLMKFLEIEQQQVTYYNKVGKDYQELNAQDADIIREFMITYQRKVKEFENKKFKFIAKIANPQLATFLAAREIAYSSTPLKDFIKQYLDVLSDTAKTETERGRDIVNLYNNYDAFTLMEQSYQMNYDTLKADYKNLDPNIKSSKYGQKILDVLDKMKATRTGNTPPNIVSTDIKGDRFELNDNLDTKLVILDFWASWCKPCREENPNYVQLYKKYKSKGLKIISYSLDTNREDWIRAVAEDGLNWAQISDIDRNDINAKRYNIRAIPSNFIIKNKKIIASNLTGETLEEFIDKQF